MSHSNNCTSAIRRKCLGNQPHLCFYCTVTGDTRKDVYGNVMAIPIPTLAVCYHFTYLRILLLKSYTKTTQLLN